MISVNGVSNKFRESILEAIDIAHDIQRSVHLLHHVSGSPIVAVAFSVLKAVPVPRERHDISLKRHWILDKKKLFFVGYFVLCKKIT